MPEPTFELVFSDEAEAVLAKLERHDKKKHDKVRKALGIMESNLRYPGLHTHEYDDYKGPAGEKVFEAYVENKTPAAYRIFFYYPKGERGRLCILTITPHP